jgi:hypothetical protein
MQRSAPPGRTHPRDRSDRRSLVVSASKAKTITIGGNDTLPTSLAITFNGDTTKAAVPASQSRHALGAPVDLGLPNGPRERGRSGGQ